MRGKILLGFGAFLLLLGTLTFQACFEENYPAYGYAPEYGYAPAYGYAAPPPGVVGDYDDHHVWHDRDWWVHNHRDWVEQHHRGWIEHHNHDRD
jgi:hypothetical protein